MDLPLPLLFFIVLGMAATMDGGSLMNSVTTGITNFGAVTQIVQKDCIQIANRGLNEEQYNPEDVFAIVDLIIMQH